MAPGARELAGSSRVLALFQDSHDAAPNTTADDPTTDPAQDSEIPFPTRELACDASGEKVVEEWLRTYLNWEVRVLSTPDDQELVTFEEPPAADVPTDADPMLIYVGPDETRVKQVPLTDDQLAEKHLDRLNQSKREAEILGIEWSYPGVAVSFAKETPWSRVVSTFATLQSLDTGPIYLGFHLPRPDELGAPDPSLMKEVSDHYSMTGTGQSPRHASSTVRARRRRSDRTRDRRLTFSAGVLSEAEYEAKREEILNDL